MKRSDSSEIGHIDSAENSEMCDSQNSESIIDDLSSLGQDLLSTMLGEKYDSVRECLESENVEKPRKYCSLAQFVEGNDIARRSIKRPTRNAKADKEILLKAKNMELTSNAMKFNLNENEKQSAKNTEGEKITSLLNPVCCFAVSLEANTDMKPAQNFPPTISVIVDPPSPSVSIESPHKNEDYKLNSQLRKYSEGSMEKCKFDLIFVIVLNGNVFPLILIYFSKR